MADDMEIPPDIDDDSSSTSSEEPELFPIPTSEGLPTGFQFDYRDLLSFDGIMKAVFSKDLAKVKELVEDGCNVRCVDNMGNTILHLAAFGYSDDSPEILEYLLSLDEVEKDAQNYLGETPLLMCTKGRLETPSEILINAGVDVTRGTLEEVTPLHYCVRFSEKLSHKLILAGADINHVDYSGDTPLHDAVAFGALEVVCLLLYYGADTSIRNSYDLTPFMLSLAGGYIQVALRLFDYVTDFKLATREGMSTLFLAITSGFPRIIDMCEFGADINWIGNSEYNVFTLNVLPKPEEFRYLWQRFDCDNWRDNSKNIIDIIFRDSNLETAEKFEILRILFENEDYEKTALLMNKSSNEPLVSRIIHMLYLMGVSEDMVHTLVACMLVCNTPIEESVLDIVYEHYGYCDTFKLLLYMDIESGPKININIFPSLIYGISWNECEFFENYNNSMVYDLRFEVVDYERIFEHFIHPEFKKNVLFRCARNIDNGQKMRIFFEYVSATPDVPLLQELARNKSRHFIRERYNATTSCKFYTILQSLSLPAIVKKLIALEIPLYKHESTQKYLDLRK